MAAVKTSPVATERIERAILVLRGHKVLLDSDLANLYEVPRRWFRMNDESEHGLGLLADAKQWENLAIGDLLGVKSPGDAFPILGVAVRE